MQGHSDAIGVLAGATARALGLSRPRSRAIAAAALLHDVGKAKLPRELLEHPGPLDARARAAVQQHTRLGHDLLAVSGLPHARLAATVALCHHERWDGAGYPSGLRGEQIPVAARIVAVVDVFDALVSRRPYKPAWPVERARCEIDAGAGTAFDPAVVEAFLAVQEAVAPPEAEPARAAPLAAA